MGLCFVHVKKPREVQYILVDYFYSQVNLTKIT